MPKSQKQTKLSLNDTPIDYRAALNDEQYRVVTQGDGPCLVLAGAGSGKTRTLVYRVAYLLEQGVEPKNILLVTFTNKASREMLHRVGQLCRSALTGLWGGTFHHVANRLLRIYGQQIGIDSNFIILDSEDSKTLLKACYEESTIPRDKNFPRVELISTILSFSVNLQQPISRIVQDRFSYLDEQCVPYLEELAVAYKLRKQQANSLDYDDLLLHALRLLRELPNLRARLSQQFKYILVDEYQDTNYLQAELITNLASHHSNILVVGDDAQSIYSFRGADINNILSFPKLFPSCQTFRLEVNYRSTPEILYLANESIRHNRRQFEKTLTADRPARSKPIAVACMDSYQQAQFICRRLEELQRKEGLALRDIAILFRSHFHSLELELELNKRSISYDLRGGIRFFEQAHIKDVIAYVKIIQNVHDEVAWLRITQLAEGIGPAGARRLWRAVQECPTLATVLEQITDEYLSRGGRAGWNNIRKNLMSLVKIEPGNVAELIRQILSSGYAELLKTRYDNPADRLDDIRQLAVFAESYDALSKFLADTALAEGFSAQSTDLTENNDDDAVVVSTIHQAKGLEWKVVFLISLIDGHFPHAKVFSSPDQIEEERRLFYVAVTRAKEQLYLTYPLLANRGGASTKISQFIEELPGDSYQEQLTEAPIQRLSMMNRDTDFDYSDTPFSDE